MAGMNSVIDAAARLSFNNPILPLPENAGKARCADQDPTRSRGDLILGVNDSDNEVAPFPFPFPL